MDRAVQPAMATTWLGLARLVQREASLFDDCGTKPQPPSVTMIWSSTSTEFIEHNDPMSTQLYPVVLVYGVGPDRMR